MMQQSSIGAARRVSPASRKPRQRPSPSPTRPGPDGARRAWIWAERVMPDHAATQLLACVVPRNRAATPDHRRLSAPPPGAASPAPKSDQEGKGTEAAATSSPGAKPAAGANAGGGKEGGREGLEGGGRSRGRSPRGGGVVARGRFFFVCGLISVDPSVRYPIMVNTPSVP